MTAKGITFPDFFPTKSDSKVYILQSIKKTGLLAYKSMTLDPLIQNGFYLHKKLFNASRQLGISNPVDFAISKFITECFGRYAFCGNSALVTGSTSTAVSFKISFAKSNQVVVSSFDKWYIPYVASTAIKCNMNSANAVSYTHLTLPTTERV